MVMYILKTYRSTMKKDSSETKKVVYYQDHAKAGGLFFVTYIGALWYFIQVSDGFWYIVLAFLKALVWPAFLVHRVFELLRI